MFLVLLASICEVATLAERGKEPFYKIVVPENCHEAIRHAADFLAEYVFRLVSVNMTVAIESQIDPSNGKYVFVGNTSFTQENLPDFEGISQRLVSKDSFYINIVKSNIFIFGGIQGCNNGVLEILEKKCGVFFFRQNFIRIPQTNVVRIELESPIEEIPAFKYRYSSFKGENEFIRFALRHNFQAWNPAKYGGSVTYACCKAVHSFDVIFKWKVFQEHPEYFSLIDGKRQYTQPCLTSEEAFNYFIKNYWKNAIDWSDHDDLSPNYDRFLFDLSLFDNWGYCQCENCSKLINETGSPAGPLIFFLNKAYKWMHEYRPYRTDYRIETLAYHQTTNAPQNIEIDPHIYIRIAPISISQDRPLNESVRDGNTYKEFVKWSKVANTKLVWYYPANHADFLYAYPTIFTTHTNYQLFKEMGVDFMYNQDMGYGAEFSELRKWVNSKLMWNPYQNITLLLETFCNNFYGPVAGPFLLNLIYEYHNECYRNQNQIWLFGTNYRIHQKIFNRSYYEFEKIIEQTKGTDFYENNQVASLLILNMVFNNRMINENLEYQWRPSEKGVFPVVNEDTKTLCQRFFKRVNIKIDGIHNIGCSEWDFDGLSIRDKIRMYGYGYDLHVLQNGSLTAYTSGFNGNCGSLRDDKYEYLFEGFQGIGHYEEHAENGNALRDFISFSAIKPIGHMDKEIESDHTSYYRTRKISSMWGTRNYPDHIKEYHLLEDSLLVRYELHEVGTTSISLNLGEFDHLYYKIEGESMWHVVEQTDLRSFQFFDLEWKNDTEITFASGITGRGVKVIQSNIRVSDQINIAYPKLGVVRIGFHYFYSPKPNANTTFQIFPIQRVPDLPPRQYPTITSNISFVNLTTESLYPNWNTKVVNGIAHCHIKDDIYSARFYYDKNIVNTSNEQIVRIHAKADFPNPNQNNGMMIMFKDFFDDTKSERVQLRLSQMINNTFHWYELEPRTLPDRGFISVGLSWDMNGLEVDQISIEDTYEYDIPTHPPPLPEDNNEEDNSKGLNSGEIAGVVIGVIFFVVLVCFLVVFIYFRYRQYTYERSSNGTLKMQI